MEPINDSFACDWLKNQGFTQSKEFMTIVVNELDELHKNKTIKIDKISTVLDWGCAMGSGTNKLQHYLTSIHTGLRELSVTGLDISWNAINACQQIFPDIEFICSDMIERNYDIVVTSNCLEHFEDPFPYMRYHIAHAHRLYVVLVPFNDKTDPGHVYQFTKESFPEELYGFIRRHIGVIPPCSVWNGEQLFVVYERKKNG